MNDLGKVNSIRLYKLWKNLTIGMVCVIAMMTVSKLLPFYLSPVASLIAAAFLYTYIYEARTKHDSSCMIVPFGLLYSLVAYSFVTILLNVLFAWGVKWIPLEFIFFNDPYIPSLLMTPICFVVFLVMTLRKNNLRMCQDCRLNNGNDVDSGAMASVFHHESQFQLKNLTCMFGVLSAIIWTYYLVFYINININARDWYMFTWLTIIFFVLDVVYFIGRYYNLYLDLKENNEIITPEELRDMTAKTYLRYYVICGNYIYVDAHAIDPKTPYKEIVDTPFFTKRSVSGIEIDEIKRTIKRMTGYEGELKFFYGRRSLDMNNHSILRYFYFLDGDISEYQEMNTDGEWMDYEQIKYLYSNNPGRLAPISVVDTTRLATIILTEKTFDANGYRKSKIKFYNPSFDLVDVRKSNLDFQDDKWLKISMFNSDTPFYSIKKRWRQFIGGRAARRESSSGSSL